MSYPIFRVPDVGCETPWNHRVETLRGLTEMVSTGQLEPNAIEALWLRVADMLETGALPPLRKVALSFLSALIKGECSCHLITLEREREKQKE